MAWLNFSPFYIAKERAQEATLMLMWKKMDSAMNGFNDMLPRSLTSTSIDKDTY